MASILRRFTFSTTSAFVLEIGDTEVSGETPYVRFFTNRQQIDVLGVPLEIESPYVADDLLRLQFKQINDLVFITHPDYPVYVLERLADTNWTLTEAVFDDPPFLAENLTDTTIAASATTGSAVSLLADADVFEEGHIGSFWQMGHKVPGDFVSLAITGNASSTELRIYGEWELHTYFNWGATITVQRRLIGATAWEDVVQKESRIPAAGAQGSANFDLTGTADVFADYRITVSGFDANSDAAAFARLDRPEATIYGYVQITDVGSGQSATATVIEDLFSTDDTALWSEGAWSEVRGYPRTCTVHEGRLVFGGTSHQPLTVWGSAPDDILNFQRGTSDGDGYSYTFLTTEQATIQWLASRAALLVGTSSGNWRIRGDGFGNPITATRVDIKKLDNEGSEHFASEECGEPIVYIARKSLKLFALRYDEGGDQLVPEEITLLAEHITSGGVREVAWQRDKRILWCVRNDGVLISLTYDDRQQVVGWCRHETQGDFRSVTTIYGDDDAEDEVWVIVERTVESVARFYVELLDPDLWTEKEDAFFVDSGLTYEGSPVTHLSGMNHLAGLDIVGLADGRVFSATVDIHGEFDLPSGMAAASTVHAGLAYTSELEPFRLDADAALGVHMGRRKKIDGVAVRVAKTVGAKYYVGADALALVPEEGQEGTDADNPPLIGDERPVDIPVSGFQQDATYNPTVRIIQDQPLPLAVLGIAVAYEVAQS